MSTALRRDQETRARGAAERQYLLDRIATSDGFQQGKEDTSSTLKRLLTALEDALTLTRGRRGRRRRGRGHIGSHRHGRFITGAGGFARTVRLRRRLGGAGCRPLEMVTPRRHHGSRGPLIRGYERPPLLAVAAASSDNDDDGALLAACASALDDEGDGKGIAAVALGLLQRQRDRAAENVLRRTDRESQIDALGHLARCAQALGPGCFRRRVNGRGVPASREGPGRLQPRGRFTSSGGGRRRVLSAAGLRPAEGDAPRRNGQKKKEAAGPGQEEAANCRIEPTATTSKVGALPGFVRCLGVIALWCIHGRSAPAGLLDRSRLEAEDQSPIGGDECSQQSFAACARAYARALRRSLGLVDAPGLLSFLERALSVNQPRHVREAALEALAERLDAQPLYDDQSKPSALARVLLEETLPRVAQAIRSDVDDSDEDSKHAAVVATRCADVLARALATPPGAAEREKGVHLGPGVGLISCRGQRRHVGKVRGLLPAAADAVRDAAGGFCCRRCPRPYLSSSRAVQELSGNPVECTSN